MKRLLNFLFIVLSLPVILSSCSKNSDNNAGDGNWFTGKSFSTLAQTDDGRTVWMVFECRLKPGYEKGYTFTITPYDLFGNRLSDVRSYSGRCTIDTDTQKIFVNYDKTSMNYNWGFTVSEDQGWPDYKPNITIYCSTNPQSYDPFKLYEFTSGKGWEQPADESVEAVKDLWLIGSIQGWNIHNGNMKLERLANGIFYGEFPVAASPDNIEFRFYSRLGEWGGDGCDFSFGSAPGDFDIVDITLPYNGKIVNGLGRWRVKDFTGTTLCVTVDLNHRIIFAENESGVSFIPVK